MKIEKISEIKFEDFSKRIRVIQNCNRSKIKTHNLANVAAVSRFAEVCQCRRISRRAPYSVGSGIRCLELSEVSKSYNPSKTS